VKIKGSNTQGNNNKGYDVNGYRNIEFPPDQENLSQHKEKYYWQ
jgi:hypothetical protein